MKPYVICMILTCCIKRCLVFSKPTTGNELGMTLEMRLCSYIKFIAIVIEAKQHKRT